MSAASTTGRTDAVGPLTGVRVVEIAQNLAGPLCGRLLADFGADVVKVEPPEGDAMRNIAAGVPGVGNQFTINNRGKRSIVVDLASDDERPVKEALIRWADVVLVALKPSSARAYGVEPGDIDALNPDAIVATLSGLGRRGPLGEDGGYDIIVQAISGLGFVGAPDVGGVPGNIRPAYSDFGTALSTALGIVTALFQRERRGDAVDVETSLLATALTYASPLVSRFELPGGDHEPGPGTEDGATGPVPTLSELRAAYFRRNPGGHNVFQYFRTRDGYLAVAALSGGLERKLRLALDLPLDVELGALMARLEERFEARTTAEWVDVLREVGVPCAALQRPDLVERHPQVVANDLFTTVVGANGVVARTPSGPIQFSGRPVEGGSVPSLDGDREEVLRWIGFQPRDGEFAG